MPTEFELYVQERMGKEKEREKSAFEIYVEERMEKEKLSPFQRYVASRQELEETQKNLPQFVASHLLTQLQ